MNSWPKKILIVLCGILFGACTAQPPPPSDSHFLSATHPPPGAQTVDPGQNPLGDFIAPTPEVTDGGPGEEGLTIQVTDMPVRDLLFSLTRDTNMNLDIYPGIQGRITLSAVNQTLPQILDRIAKQVDLRYEIQGQNVIVSPDRPYLHIYKVDYVNIARTTKGDIRVATQLAGDVSGENKEAYNQTTTDINNTSKNEFWTTLTNNITLLLNQDDTQHLEEAPSAKEDAGALMPFSLDAAADEKAADASKTATDSTVASKRSFTPGIVAVNSESGLMSVFASHRQHQRIKELLDQVMDSAQRQVLIESTVVEVNLNDDHQQGIDWTRLSGTKGSYSLRTLTQTTNQLTELPFFSLNFTKGADLTKTVDVTIHALEEFGNVKVLSSPKIMTLNNQPAILKVVDNRVYFTIDTRTDTADNNVTTQTYATRAHTVPVGLVMTVTPQISSNDMVSLNVRPTITRILGWQNDPNPALKAGVNNLKEDVISRVPEIQVREMESMLRIHSGQVSVMGGLMEDSHSDTTTGLPAVSRVPFLGGIFSVNSQSTRKTELVVFLRPVIIEGGVPKQTAPTPVQRNAFKQPAPAKTAWGMMPGSNPGTNNASYLDFTNPGAGSMAPLSTTPVYPVGTVMGGGAPNDQVPSAPQDAPLVFLSPTSGSACCPPASGIPQAMPPAANNGYSIRIGSYLSRESADKMHKRLSDASVPVYVEEATVQGRTYTRLLSGPFPDRRAAEDAFARIEKETGIKGEMVAY